MTAAATGNASTTVTVGGATCSAAAGALDVVLVDVGIVVVVAGSFVAVDVVDVLSCGVGLFPASPAPPATGTGGRGDTPRFCMRNFTSAMHLLQMKRRSVSPSDASR